MLLPVLGLTWACGVLVHLSIVWAYVFIVLNSLQVSPVPAGPSHRSQAGIGSFLRFAVLCLSSQSGEPLGTDSPLERLTGATAFHFKSSFS